MCLVFMRLVIEEQDYGSMASADIVDASAAPFGLTIRAMNDFLLKKGIMDRYFGRRVHSLVEQLGFVEVGQDGWTRMIQGGEPYSRWAAVSLQAGTRPMIDAGLLTQEHCDSIVRLLLDDQSFSYPGPALFSAWGRKPVQGVGT